MSISCGFFNLMKDPSHLALIGRDFHHLVLSDNLNEHGAVWMCRRLVVRYLG
jgi:hypothetical protein